MGDLDRRLVGWVGAAMPCVTQLLHRRPVLGYALRANPTYASSTSGRGVGGVTGLHSRCYDTAAQSESGQPSRLTGATGTHG